MEIRLVSGCRCTLKLLEHETYIRIDVVQNDLVVFDLGLKVLDVYGLDPIQGLFLREQPALAAAASQLWSDSAITSITLSIFVMAGFHMGAI
jgi:hypothetical protein